MDISNVKQQSSECLINYNSATSTIDDMFVGWNPPPNEPNEKKGKGVPRLSHKKSKTGCKRCRARRVKCDEAKPVCAGCSRHQVTCTYDEPAGAPKDASLAASSSSAKLNETNTNIPETTKRRLLELKLMHHWTQTCCHTFPLSADQSLREINTTILPNLGLMNEALLYCLFFLSALHLIKTDRYTPEAAGAYQYYLDLTIRFHRVDVTNISSANADVIYLTASLLRFGSFAILPDRSLVPYKAPIQWMQMNQSAGAVHRATWPFIGENPASIAYRAMVQKAPNLLDFETLYHESNRQSLLYLLTNPPGYEEPWSAEIEKAYHHTISYIGAIQRALDGGIEDSSQILRRSVGFPGLVPKHFGDMVEEERPRALVIMAHYFAYLARFKDIWYIGNSGMREVRAIAGFVGEPWKEMMRWPVAEVERIYS